ncbi:MAG: potassium transporter TrkA [Bacteroidetes bacterium]|jgi:Trk K+ transport system NAD-binding subunit|nr:potassium transporter TrkA [Bacteroidota bacterium]
MKFTFSSELAFFLKDKEAKRNLFALLRYVAFLLAVMGLFGVLFQVIMVYVEGQQHSWLSGFYWVLVTMSTLGFGDIVFHTDIGRAFSMTVVVSGIILLLVVLPYAFIRYFYAPWLEAQIHARAPREAPSDMRNHVIICVYDSIAPGLIERLEEDEIPYVVLEEDPERASRLYLEGISTVAGATDDRATFEAVRASRARMVVVNDSDTENTNIILTLREVAPSVEVVALAERQASVDILQLSGADSVVALKKRLGQQLANRMNAMHAFAHPVGHFKDLLIAEVPAHNTPLAGHTIRETQLRENTGVSIIGVWERGRLMAARPDQALSHASVPVVMGTAEQLEALNELLLIYDVNPNPVLIIGGGEVGLAAARVLESKNIAVHIVEKDKHLEQRLRNACTKVFMGDAAEYEILLDAGIEQAPSVLLSTHDDATNIYLASYCRNLNEDLRIISRITSRRNIEAIHRAGADFVLSYNSLGVEAVYAILKERDVIILGEGVDFFSVALPSDLHGRTLKASGIGAKTGLTVIAIEYNGTTITNLGPDTELQEGMELLMLGDHEQRHTFMELYGTHET